MLVCYYVSDSTVCLLQYLLQVMKAGNMFLID